MLLVAVAGLDRAAIRAVRYSRLIPATDRRAVHVVNDEDTAFALGSAWMQAGLADRLRLEMVDPVGTVADSLAVVASDLLNGGAAEVVVLATQQVGRRPWRMHRDHTGMEIHREITRVQGARSLLLDVTGAR